MFVGVLLFIGMGLGFFLKGRVAHFVCWVFVCFICWVFASLVWMSFTGFVCRGSAGFSLRGLWVCLLGFCWGLLRFCCFVGV